MKNKKLIIAISFIAGLGLIISVSSKFMSKRTRPGASSGAKGRKILYYRAPMNPAYISDKPGKSPMGMDLVPVYEGEGYAGTGVVKIDPVTVQNIGVKTERIRRRDLSKVIRTVGRVDYDERRIAYVNTKIGGWIEKLYVDYTGQGVEKGEKLLEIYSPELVATEEEYLLALEYSRGVKQSKFEEISDKADLLLEASRKRLEYWDISDEQIEDLRKTGLVKKTLTIHSPTKGVVIHKNALEGKYTKPGENLYKIADISRIWVYADIYEYEVPWVNVGHETGMSLSYLPGKVFKGKVTYLYPYLESKTRTVKVRMEFDNPDWELKPDMYADVVLHTDPRKGVLSVPKEAVIHSGEREVVIIDKGKGLFDPRDVKLGLESSDYYEVLSGVEEGEDVVTSSQFLIDSESRLKEAISKMLEAKKTASPKAKTPPSQREVSVKEAARRFMDEAWRHYFNIRRSLADDSLLGIKEDARFIQKDMDGILNSDATAEMKLLAKDILKQAGALYSRDITRLREAFLEISNSMIRYMKEFDREGSMAKGYTLFFCGMEEKFWVQDDKNIGNPYLGESMSGCGASEDY